MLFYSAFCYLKDKNSYVLFSIIPLNTMFFPYIFIKIINSAICYIVFGNLLLKTFNNFVILLGNLFEIYKICLIFAVFRCLFMSIRLLITTFQIFVILLGKLLFVTRYIVSFFRMFVICLSGICNYFSVICHVKTP